jgi:membrane fusion protein, multidrug efflux system
VTGIAAGEVVSISSFDKLQDGSKVTVQNADAAKGPAAPNTGADMKAGKTS